MNFRLRKEHARQFLRAARPVVRTVLPALLSLLWALGCALALDLALNGWSFSELYRSDIEKEPVLTLLGALVVWAVLVLVWALVGRLAVAVAMLSAVAALLVFANHMKLTLRLEPIFPSDLAYLSQIGFLVEMVGLTNVILLLAGTVTGMAAIVWGGHRLTRSRPRPKRSSDPRAWRRAVAARVVAGALSVSFLGYLGSFNDPGNEFREAYDANGAEWAYWAQRMNYLRNGFVGGVLYNLDVNAMEEPRGYSSATMDEVVDRYTRLADRLNRDRSPDALDDVNIVVVLSESFTDPTQLSGLRFEEDPIPFTRRLMSETTSGTMLAQKYGGGTANMEFEALTGMSLSQFSPQMDSPYQMMVPEYSSFPSAVKLLEDRGHASIAIHPFTTQMYRRESVYPVLGFDDFVSMGEMQQEAKIDDSHRISDASAFDEVSYQIGRSRRPLLVNLVTMQNHFPSRGIYDDPPEVGGVRAKVEEHVAGYVQGLSHSDAALEDFVTDLEGSSERTAVIFYGDHHPAIWPGRVRDKSGELAALSTPWFVWANFPLEKLPRDELTSPIHFLPMLYEAAGAQVPPYYALLSRLHDVVPAMELGRYVERGRGLVSESGLSRRAVRVLRDYRLVQYDLSVGERYSLDELFGPGAESVSAARQVTLMSRER